MDSINIDVSIIFVNYKSKNLTINAIKAVKEKTEGLEYEIIVVDNNSQDGSIEAIQEEFNGIERFPNNLHTTYGKEVPVFIIKNSYNAGFGAANNIGIKLAKGKYILCLNTDTILLNNAIKIMFDFMQKEENQKVGACGANLYHQDLSPAFGDSKFHNFWNCSSVYWIIKHIFRSYYSPKEIKSNTKTEVVTGADLFIRKTVLDEIGLFDANIFMYSEDTDLCKRIYNNNNDIYIVADAKIMHLEGRNKKNFLIRTGIVVQGKYYYLRKYKMYPSLFFMKISYIFLHLICFLFTFNSEHTNLIKIHFRG